MSAANRSPNCKKMKKGEVEEHDHEDHGDDRGEVIDVLGVVFKSGTKI